MDYTKINNKWKKKWQATRGVSNRLTWLWTICDKLSWISSATVSKRSSKRKYLLFRERSLSRKVVETTDWIRNFRRESFALEGGSVEHPCQPKPSTRCSCLKTIVWLIWFSRMHMSDWDTVDAIMSCLMYVKDTGLSMLPQQSEKMLSRCTTCRDNMVHQAHKWWRTYQETESYRTNYLSPELESICLGHST